MVLFPDPYLIARNAWRLAPLRFRTRTGAAVRAAFGPAIARELPRANPADRRPANAASVLGVQSSPLGIGAGARLLARELKAAAIDIRAVDVTSLIGAPQDRAAMPADDDPARPLIIVLNPDVAMHALRARRPQLEGRRVIGFWVWELDRLPPSWRVGAGWVHEIWTPSRYSAAAFAEFGVPVVVTPHPVALNPPPVDPSRRGPVRARLGVGEGVFLAVSSFSLSSSLARKNPLGAIAAFRRAFPRGDARLVLRCLGGERRADTLRRLRAAAAEAGPSVLLLDGPSPVSELYDLYAAADAYLSLHRAEGFGLNLAEAMLSRLPVIATGYSANLEYMDETCAMLVPAMPVSARDPDGDYAIAGAVWAEPDIVAAADALARLAEDKTLRARLGEAAFARASGLVGGAAARALRLA